MPVPLLDLKAQNIPLEAELSAVFTRVLRSGHYILGPEVEAFENEIAGFLGVPHAIGVSSGTDAILLALMALEIGPGDEVICPSFTFFATAGCIARVGARPVFVDSCPICFNMDVADTRAKLSPRTKAIIPVHLFGQAAPMADLSILAREAGIPMIEDAAQSLGAHFQGKPLGTFGAFGAYSFFPTKNLGAFGDAGLLVTSDAMLAEKARILRVHGAKPKYFHKFVGANFRIDALQAALLRVKLPHFQRYNIQRSENAAFYTSELSRLSSACLPSARSCVCGTANSPDAPIILPSLHSGNDHIWNQYTLRLTRLGHRQRVLEQLQKSGIGAEIYYPVPLHEQECFSRFVPPASVLPVASMLSRQCLSIPIFPELTPDQREKVASALKDALE